MPRAVKPVRDAVVVVVAGFAVAVVVVAAVGSMVVVRTTSFRNDLERRRRVAIIKMGDPISEIFFCKMRNLEVCKNKNEKGALNRKIAKS